ncbi:chymotrypsin B-like [Trichogramma pretiosum]|uniref:chymotrypsin B-like n=1 Tax=Trichogramma pretiosum TaxID=7493 RepID=UPI000C71B6A1|nr:chymotrypsin B-like [Trichogramma pretiosum]
MGGIVGSVFAVTAAHCFVDERGEPISNREIHAQVGAPDYRASRISTKVVRAYLPADYRKSDGGMAGMYDRADIAVVRLARNVVKLPNSHQLKISPLPRSHVFGRYDTSLVAGYGRKRTDPTHADSRLRYAMMKPVDDEICGYNYLLGGDDTVFCAAITAANAGASVCEGDDGTPYVQRSGITGILSHVPADCLGTSDAIFTKIGPYRQFISRAMADDIDHTIKVVDFQYNYYALF